MYVCTYVRMYVSTYVHTYIYMYNKYIYIYNDIILIFLFLGRLHHQTNAVDGKIRKDTLLSGLYSQGV